MNLVGHFRIRALLSLIEKKKEKATKKKRGKRNEKKTGNMSDG